jgi:hypothetical protein
MVIMKVRQPTRCERCKRVYPTGTAMVMRHRRQWCLDCAVAYIRERHARKVAA